MKNDMLLVSPANLNRALKFELRSGMDAKRAAQRAESTPRERFWVCTSETCTRCFFCCGNEASTGIPPDAFWKDLLGTRTLAGAG